MNQNKIIYPQKMMDRFAKEQRRMPLADKIGWSVLFVVGAYIVSLLIGLIIK